MNKISVSVSQKFMNGQEGKDRVIQLPKELVAVRAGGRETANFH